ncbi:MAG: ATP-binding protein, partial [Acidaminococcaceae bacterium]|nr:ATP-binding protein [Acidaminococcaceae bacterium]
MENENVAKEKFEFQAETKQLLNLMINSIYTNHEIFLRELISNASDAIDKLRFASLTNSDLLEGDSEFVIRLTPDEKAKTLTITDNGIGMTKDEVIKNIGTIAQSGTKEFLAKLEEANKIAKKAEEEAGKEAKTDATTKDLIGQFGVGFYSAFMVSDKVTLITRKAGEKEGWKWESAADGTYTIEPCEVEKHGTSITLQLGEAYAGEGAEQDMTSYWTLESLVKKYSDYIRYPIKMEETTEEPARNDKGDIDDKLPPIKKTEDKTLNSQTPLWKRNKSSIKPEEYNEFFKHQFHEWEDPMWYYHTRAEGTV